MCALEIESTCVFMEPDCIADAPPQRQADPGACTQAGSHIASLQGDCEELTRDKQHLALKSSQQEDRIADLFQQAQAHAAAAESMRCEMQLLQHDADASREALEAAELSTRSAEQRYSVLVQFRRSLWHAWKVNTMG